MSMAEARAGYPSRGGGRRSITARAALVRALWNARGERRLPTQRELDAALSALSAEELDWMLELSPLAPLYFLPTRPFVHALAKQLRALGVERVLEVAAGDGFLSRCLRRAAPDLQVIATDSGAWQQPAARMSASEVKRYAKLTVPGLALGRDVERCDATRAIRKHRPDLVLCAWLPPGHLLDSFVRARTQYVLEIGAGAGVTGSAYSWRFAHDFLEGKLAASARCRLDGRPARQLHSRITLYYGRAHEAHHEERVHPEDWLYQFRPPRPSTR